MALIKCEECGQMVSTKASFCPHCGAPVEKKVEKKIICEECGAEITSDMNECSNCGCPIEKKQEDCKPQVEEEPQVENKPPTYSDFTKPKEQESTKKTVEMSWWVICVLSALVIFIIVFFVATCKGTNSRTYTYTHEESVPEKIKKVRTIEEARSLIDNTTWHYTENTSTDDIGFWVKVEFKNGRYTCYHAQPSDGKWTQKGEGEYEVVEERYSNTGEKYIAVRWEGGGYFGWPSKYALVLENFQLSVVSALPNISSTRITPAKPSYGYMKFGDYEWN